jgi:hypothetical protein
MKKTLSFLLPLSLLATAAFGQLYTDEGFSSAVFTSGTTVHNQGSGSGWNGNWAVDASANANNIHRYWASGYALDYTDLHGNSLLTTPGSLQLRSAGSGNGPLSRPFAEPAAGEVWFSFLNIRTSTQAWGYELQFLDAGGAIQFRIENDGSGNFRLNQTSGSTAALSITNHTADEAPQGQLFVGRVTNAGSGTNNASLTVWVNPANLLDLSEGAAATASLSGRQIDAISQFAFAKGANQTGYFDELRIGGSAESVMPIPEPATWALWTGLLGLVLLGWRKRIRN